MHFSCESDSFVRPSELSESTSFDSMEYGETQSSVAIAAEKPVCLLHAGYISEYLSTAFGMEIVTVEIFCRATGAKSCEFVVTTSDRIESFVLSICTDLEASQLPTLQIHKERMEAKKAGTKIFSKLLQESKIL